MNTGMDTNEKEMTEGLIRLPQVLKVFPVGRSTWYEGVRTGKYPPSVKVSARCVAWHSRDIRALVAQGTWQPH
jgi:prophage regulatory protein